MENFSCLYFIFLWIGKKSIFYICLCFANVFATPSFILCFGIGLCVKLVALIIHDAIYNARASYLFFLSACPQLIFCDAFSYYSFVVNLAHSLLILLIHYFYLLVHYSFFHLSAKLNVQVRVITSYGNVFSFFLCVYIIAFCYIYVSNLRRASFIIYLRFTLTIYILLLFYFVFLLFALYIFHLFFSFFVFCFYIFLPLYFIYMFSLFFDFFL